MTTNLIEVPAGVFSMGAIDSPHPEDGEGPSRTAELDAYSIAATAVSNREFFDFVDITNYITVAEKAGGSQVFKGELKHPEQHQVISPMTPWWRWVDGANWRKPDGLQERGGDFPVVHVSLFDAIAYCNWADVRLPTEAQWERAAALEGEASVHIWQGEFPDGPTVHPSPKPVDEAKPNKLGLYHACGNVWEWTADNFSTLHSPRPAKNPSGPLNGKRIVVKGGSFLCSPSYCSRFRPSSRRGEHPHMTASHLGFRVSKC